MAWEITTNAYKSSLKLPTTTGDINAACNDVDNKHRNDKAIYIVFRFAFFKKKIKFIPVYQWDLINTLIHLLHHKSLKMSNEQTKFSLNWAMNFETFKKLQFNKQLAPLQKQVKEFKLGDHPHLIK